MRLGVQLLLLQVLAVLLAKEPRAHFAHRVELAHGEQEGELDLRARAPQVVDDHIHQSLGTI